MKFIQPRKMKVLNSSINVVWFLQSKNITYGFLWEFDKTNIWWKPKFIKEKYSWHVGWLVFQIGICKHIQ